MTRLASFGPAIVVPSIVIVVVVVVVLVEVAGRRCHRRGRVLTRHDGGGGRGSGRV